MAHEISEEGFELMSYVPTPPENIKQISNKHFCAYTETGTRHLRTNVSNQDAYFYKLYYDNPEWILFIFGVIDGHGMKERDDKTTTEREIGEYTTILANEIKETLPDYLYNSFIQLIYNRQINEKIIKMVIIEYDKLLRELLKTKYNEYYETHLAGAVMACNIVIEPKNIPQGEGKKHLIRIQLGDTTNSIYILSNNDVYTMKQHIVGNLSDKEIKFLEERKMFYILRNEKRVKIPGTEIITPNYRMLGDYPGKIKAPEIFSADPEVEIYLDMLVNSDSNAICLLASDGFPVSYTHLTLPTN